jgi:hypothetical protein
MALRYFARPATSDDDRSQGPWSAAELQAQLNGGTLEHQDMLCLEGGSCWAPAAAWADLALPVSPPPRHHPERMELPDDVAALDDAERDALRWWLREGGTAKGPYPGQALREELTYSQAADVDAVVMIARVGGSCWFPRSALERISHGPWRAIATSEAAPTRCPICLETIPAVVRECPECGEPSGPFSTAGAVVDVPASEWVKLHWRPMLTLTVLSALLVSGIALRHLAPDRHVQEERVSPPTAAVVAACDVTCWHGEACERGRCAWQSPNDIGPIVEDKLSISGPFQLPGDFTDVLPMGPDRYAVAELLGVRVHDSRTGAELTLVSDAPHAQLLYSVRDVVYATSPKGIYVIDAATTRVLKMIEIGSAIGELVVGAEERRVLASIPGAKAVAVLASDYHAEVSRFYFGDIRVRPLAMDDTGTRALTTNGRVPVFGLRAPSTAVERGAMYAFDPSRLPSEQDKVRTGLVGNPVDIVMVPDGKTSFVLLREEDAMVRLERLESGIIRQGARIGTCDEPEQIELIRRGRRAIVRCNAGRALEIFDISEGKLLRRIPLESRVADLAVSPDGRSVLLALPHDSHRSGAVGWLDLDSYELTMHEIGGEPTRLRFDREGRSVAVISDTAKAAWVLR